MMTQQRDPWVYKLLGEHNFQRTTGFLPWWYRLTSPPDLENPTLQQRDLARRSKILSALALFLGLTLLMVAYIALSGPNKVIINTVYILYVTLLLCLVLNRRGHINTAGALLITGQVGGMYFSLVMTALHGGLTPNDKDIFYLPFFGELIAAALLPPFAIGIIAASNTVISLLLLYRLPHTSAFTLMMGTGASSIIFRIIEIHFFVALVLSIMATWQTIAIRRADRAEELARLSHDLNESTTEKLREQMRLQCSIDEISHVHAQVANGNLGARVPLNGNQVLWQIAGSLNKLLDRYMRAVRVSKEGEMATHVLNHFLRRYPGLGPEATTLLKEIREQQSSTPEKTTPKPTTSPL